MSICNEWHPTYAYIPTNVLYLQIDATYDHYYAAPHIPLPSSDSEPASSTFKFSANLCSEGYSDYLVSGLMSTVIRRLISYIN